MNDESMNAPFDPGPCQICGDPAAVVVSDATLWCEPCFDTYNDPCGNGCCMYVGLYRFGGASR